MNYDRLNLHVEKAAFMLVAISLTVYISGYHLAKPLLFLYVFLASFLFISKPRYYFSVFSWVDIAWLSTLSLYPLSYYIAFIVHERPLDLSRGNEVAIDSLIGVSLYLILRKTDYFTLEKVCRYTAVSLAVAGSVVVWQWVANDFQGRWTTGTNLILIFACVASAATMMTFWYLTHGKENMWVRAAVFYAGAIGLVSVVAAGARGAWVAIMVLFCLYMVYGILKKRLVLLVIPAVVAVATSMWVMQENVGNQRIGGTVAGIVKFIETNEVSDGSMKLRVGMWHAAIEGIKDHPILGVGNGALKEVFSEKKLKDAGLYNFDHVHNDVLQAWSALGILGLISIFALMAIPIWTAVSHKSPATPYLIIIAVVFGVNGLIDVPFLKTYSLKYYVMTVGLLLIIHQKNTIRSD